MTLTHRRHLLLFKTEFGDVVGLLVFLSCWRPQKVGLLEFVPKARNMTTSADRTRSPVLVGS